MSSAQIREPPMRALTDAAPIHGEARLHCAFLTDCEGLRVRRVKAILAHAPSASDGRIAAGLAGALVLPAAAPATASAWWAAAEPAATQPSTAQPTATNVGQDEALSTQVGDAVAAIQTGTLAGDFASAIDSARKRCPGSRSPLTNARCCCACAQTPSFNPATILRRSRISSARWRPACWTTNPARRCW